MNKDLTIQVAEAPDYDPASFRSYASILHETFAVLGKTPAPSSVDIPHKTREDLQWSALKARLADYCVGQEARRAAESLPTLQHRESLERRHCEVEEAVRLTTLDVPPPLTGLLPIGPYLEHAARGGVLEAEHLLAVAQVARATGAVQKYFRTRGHLAPLLAQPADDLQPTPDLVQAMEHAFDPSGRLSDSASPDLGDLRRRVQNYHERLKRRLDGYLGSKDFANFLQDDYFTLRNDRYVLPIRAGEKGNVPGIVHGSSGSGQTLFIEPTELVDMNNDLQIAQMEVEEEERRILARLTALVASRAPKLAANLALLAYVDLTVAKARLACTLGATRPVLSRRGALDLRQARHPVLALKALDSEKPFEVVANDISLGLDGLDPDAGVAGALPSRQNVLIISGPNTGGKTVTLKTIGVFCLMARSGLHLPAMAGSEVPLVDAIFTDIGDEQSIERDLSTFSGHVANINSFINRVDAGSLVLLDELFAGTDPEQGAALATALLEDLAGRGALVAITTHLESLKMLAFKAGGVSNASVGFDLASLSPTYRLQTGLPGSSYAIRIAHRLGLPGDIVSRAQAVAHDTGAADVETILRQLEQKRDALDRDANRARQLRRDAEKLHAQVEKKLESLHKREMGLVHQETRKLMDEIHAARDLIRRHTRALQEANAPGALSHEALGPIRDEINAVAANITELREARETETILERREPRPWGTLEVGATVWVKTFKRSGEVLDLDRDRERAVVRVGGIKATVTLDELFAVRPEEVPAKAPQPTPLTASNAFESSHERVMAIPPQGEGNTVDLRGMRVEEALERIEIFLDAAMRAQEPGIYIIHGHGTGALRSAVRAFMPSCRYVHSYRPGGQGEGGDGVTVAFLG